MTVDRIDRYPTYRSNVDVYWILDTLNTYLRFQLLFTSDSMGPPIGTSNPTSVIEKQRKKANAFQISQRRATRPSRAAMVQELHHIPPPCLWPAGVLLIPSYFHSWCALALPEQLHFSAASFNHGTCLRFAGPPMAAGAFICRGQEWANWPVAITGRPPGHMNHFR